MRKVYIVFSSVFLTGELVGKKCFLVILNYILIFCFSYMWNWEKKKKIWVCFLVWNWEEKSFDRIFIFIFNFWVRLSKTWFHAWNKKLARIFFFLVLLHVKTDYKKILKVFYFFFYYFFCVKLRKKTSTVHTWNYFFFSNICIFLIYFFYLSFYMFCQFSSYKHSREKQCRLKKNKKWITRRKKTRRPWK